MKSSTRFAATAGLSLVIAISTFALAQQTNEQDRKDAIKATEHDSDASKAQHKADKKERKDLKSDKAKDAAKAQDKADAKAAKADR